jgi:hypothetical protein
MTTEDHNISIIESYVNYEPPFPIKSIISDLLNSISKQYLIGLQAVILTNALAMNRKGRRNKTLSRKKKVALVECLGLYNAKWNDGPATIQLFIDNIIKQQPKWSFMKGSGLQLCK